MMEWNGRKVLAAEEWDYSRAMVGDLVEQEFVDDMLDVLPPACMRPDCAQMGEAYSHRQDPDTGEWKPTFFTFKKVGGEWPHGIFEYCGKCFRGENAERGKSRIVPKRRGLDGEQGWPYIPGYGGVTSAGGYAHVQ